MGELLLIIILGAVFVTNLLMLLNINDLYDLVQVSLLEKMTAKSSRKDAQQ